VSWDSGLIRGAFHLGFKGGTSMSIILKTPKSLRDAHKQWLAHQLKRDPMFQSRREFLEKSAAGITALTFMPAIFSLLTKTQTAKAANELSAAAIILSLPGGFSASPEVVPLDIDGKFLQAGSYKNLGRPLGVNESFAEAISTSYGAPLWKTGKLFKMFESMAREVDDNGMKISVAVGWHSNSLDDSLNNPVIASPHILKALTDAKFKFRILGTQVNSNTDSGGRGKPTAEFPGFKPAVANNLKQVQDLMELKKGALSGVSEKALSAATVLAHRITVGAKARFAAMNSGRQLAELTEAANRDLVEKIGNTPKLVPINLDPNIAPFFNLSDQTQLGVAANLKLITDNLSPLLALQINANFDYHDATTGWNDDIRGQHALVANTLRPILRACAKAGKSVGIMLSTDGATSFDESMRAIGDFAPIHGSIYIFLHKKSDPPLKRFQLGGMLNNEKDGGSANTDVNLNILQRHPSYEGHVLTASLLGMLGLEVKRYAVSNIKDTDFEFLNLFK